MAKVRTLSRKFMQGHPRVGEPTLFPEKFLNSIEVSFWHTDYYDKLLFLNSSKLIDGSLSLDDIKSFWISLQQTNDNKHHTIRGGHPDKFKEHFKKGDKISIRCWSGKPYASPQIILWDDVELKEVYDVYIKPVDAGGKPHVSLFIEKDWKCFAHIPSPYFNKISSNDGLSPENMSAWFNKLPFKGQILVWGDVKY